LSVYHDADKDRKLDAAESRSNALDYKTSTASEINSWIVAEIPSQLDPSHVTITIPVQTFDGDLSLRINGYSLGNIAQASNA
jgi:hypothetical protein